jgi:hypothetical protein
MITAEDAEKKNWFSAAKASAFQSIIQEPTLHPYSH